MKIKDIANSLNLSLSTVSKALNNATDVSDETKKRVLDYLASVGATMKKRNTNKRFMIVLEDMGMGNESICYDVLNGFRTAASEYNYDIIIKSVSQHDTVFSYDREIKQNNFLGAFVMGTNLMSPLYKQLQTTVFPTVVLDNYIQSKNVSILSVDNIRTVNALVDYLAGQGHRRIAFLCGEKESVVSRERFGGYVCGLLNNNLDYDDGLVYFGDYTENCSLKFIDKIIAGKATAVMCASDLIAIGLIKELRKHGLSVPQDLSVTGFDDISLSKYITPTLTTVSQDFNALGKNAFVMLRQLTKNNAPDRVVMDGKLEIRESTAPPKKI